MIVVPTGTAVAPPAFLIKLTTVPLGDCSRMNRSSGWVWWNVISTFTEFASAPSGTTPRSIVIVTSPRGADRR